MAFISLFVNTVIPKPSLVHFLLSLFIPLFRKYFAAFFANNGSLCLATSALALNAVA